MKDFAELALASAAMLQTQTIDSSVDYTKLPSEIHDKSLIQYKVTKVNF
jgi:hypothetical protein